MSLDESRESVADRCPRVNRCIGEFEAAVIQRDNARGEVAALQAEGEQLRASLNSMDHFAEVAERVERRNNVLRAEVDRLRAAVEAALLGSQSVEVSDPAGFMRGVLRGALEPTEARVLRPLDL